MNCKRQIRTSWESLSQYEIPNGTSTPNSASSSIGDLIACPPSAMMYPRRMYLQDDPPSSIIARPGASIPNSFIKTSSPC